MQIRNHPCVYDYTMDNEDIGLDIAADLYKTAKQLDPTRLVNTADGVWPDPAHCCPYTDFQSHGFALNTIPALDPHQFGKGCYVLVFVPTIREMRDFLSRDVTH
eukprot:SAG31_NODE_14597_length_797_cov_1.323782_1_plen_104_part_00